MLYTAKGTASLLVPLAAYVSATRGWVAVFWVAMGFNVAAAMLALCVLKPMRARWLAMDTGGHRHVLKADSVPADVC